MSKSLRVLFLVTALIFTFGLSANTLAQDHSIQKVPAHLGDQVKDTKTNWQYDGQATGYGDDALNDSWVSVDIPGGGLTTLGAMTFLMQGGDFANGTFYGINGDTGELITVNTADGTVTVVGSVTGVTSGQTITALGYDESSGVMYLGTTNITTSELYTIDLNTAAATLVGATGQAGLIAMLVTCDGSIYTVDLVDDMLWSVDPGTGAGTPVGALGYDANFAQDADVDAATGIGYLAAYNNGTSSGQLREVDFSTGNTTMLADWGGVEITGFGIDETCGPPCPVGDPTNPDPPNGEMDVPVMGTVLSWTNDAGADEIEVFFGPAGNMVSVYQGTPTTSYDPGLLAYDTDYNWRVDQIDTSVPCTNTGPTWNFTTEQDPNLMVICDDFTNGLVNWDVVNDGGDCVWDIFDASEYDMPPEATGNVAAADADACGSGTTTLTTMTSVNPYDATLSDNIWVEFDQDFRTIDADDEAYVEVSTDGSTWTTVWSQIGTSLRNTHETVDISAEVAGNEFWLRFRTVQPGWDWWWAVDNVCVYMNIVPVELSSFTADVSESTVTLNWTTATETNNDRFEVQRKAQDGQYEVVGTVQGNGTTTEVSTYSFVDDNVVAGNYTYRLKQIDFSGAFEYSEAVEVEVNVPKEFSLAQNYPNPFNPSTTIKYTLAVDSKVTLKVFDVLGQEVMTLINSDLAAGGHEVQFNASNINSGVYFYQLNAEGVDGTNFTSVKKMILTK